MFQIEIIEQIGKKPLVLEASQVVVRLDGSPVCVAALFAGSNSIQVAHCVDKNFNEVLQKMQINETVIDSEE
mgnify:CR=1 FL=1